MKGLDCSLCNQPKQQIWLAEPVKTTSGVPKEREDDNVKQESGEEIYIIETYDTLEIGSRHLIPLLIS